MLHLKTYSLLILIFTSLLSFGQTPNAISLCDSLLKAGEYKAAIVSYDFTGEIKELQLKCLKNLKNNPEWADKYIIIQAERGDNDLAFLSEMGLSKDEFRKMVSGFKEGKEAILSDTFSFIITKKNNILTLRAASPATIFNKLKVNLNNKEITYEDLKLTRELKETGQSEFQPRLSGYQAFNSQPLSNIKASRSIDSFGMYIGINKGNKKKILCFNYKKTFASEVKMISICIL